MFGFLKNYPGLLDAYKEIKNRYGNEDNEYFEKLREQNKTDATKSNMVLLYACLVEGDTEIAKLLLKYGADVNFLWLQKSILGYVFDYRNAIDNTRLIKTICFLLDNGANANYINGFGNTLLCRACRYGDMVIVRLLLERGANPNILDKSGDSPLYYACYRGNIEIVKLLIQHGAEINSQAFRDEALREIALRHGHTEIASFLEQKEKELHETPNVK